MQFGPSRSSLPAARPSRRCPERPSRRSSSASTSADADAVPGEHDQAVEPQVGGLVDHAPRARRPCAAITVSVASSPTFFRIASWPFALQRRDVGRLPGRRRGARAIAASSRSQDVALSSSRLPVPSSTGLGRAPSGALRPRPRGGWKKQRRRPVWQAMPPTDSHAQQHRVGVAVERISSTLLHVARGLALVPQRAARARPVHAPRRVSTVRSQRLAVHPREREHLAGRRVLRDRGHQAVGVPGHRVEPARSQPHLDAARGEEALRLARR